MTAFASALKNMTVYPANHPRVVERATEFVQSYRATTDGPRQLLVKHDGFELDGEPIESDHLALAWLHARCRDTGTGAIHLEANCRPSDVIQFATAMIECRPGSGASLAERFRDDSAAVRPVALVIEDRMSADDCQAPNEAGKGPAPIDATTSLTDKLRAIAESPSVLELTKALASSEPGGNEPKAEFDLVAMVSEVLPVDCPTEPAALQQTIEDILRRTHAQLQQRPPTDHDERQGNLLRSAVDIAKTWFGRSNQELADVRQQPSGRPEDDDIQADVAQLVREMASLPDASGLRLPPIHELTGGTTASTHELLGICLHGLTIDRRETGANQRMTMITRLVHDRPGECAAVLDTYLRAGSQPNSVRLPVLRALVHSGLDGIVRERRYLDDGLLRAGFPEVLPIAARTFATRDEHARVRAALDDLATMIDNGGAAAVAQTRVLDDIATLQLLIHCGGKVAWQLLSQCAPDGMHAQRMLLQCCQGLELPEPEHVVVHVCASIDVPSTYLRSLLMATAREQFDEALRRESAAIIRSWIDANLHKQSASHLAAAVKALRFAPDQVTTNFLKELVRQGRFSLRPGPRELRQHALATLKEITSGGPT